MRSLTITLVVACLGLQPLESAAGAQGKRHEVTSRVPVTIAISDRLPPASRFLVKRFPTGAHTDVLLLAADATAEDLSDGIRTLLSVRLKDGDLPSAERTVRMRPRIGSTTTRPAFPWTSRVLTDVRAAPEAVIPGVGKVRAVQIWLPPQNPSSPAQRAPRT